MTGRSTHTVNKIIKAYKEEKRICDAPHHRCPRATTEQQEQVLAAGAYASPFNTAKEIGEFFGVEASVSILKRKLAEQGLRSRIAARKPHLSERNKTSSVGFAVNHASRTVNDWKDVIFFPTKLQFLQRGTKNAVCGALTARGTSNAIFKSAAPHRRKLDSKYANIVEYVLIPYALDGPFPDGHNYYQHDLSPVHTAKRVKQLI
ncbi:hypothetical protein HPB52_010664 [Rhipicephalus sanguineus]|uniref:Transposase Tc1-like domain-containing protein n=1 Tax=Rhipicephalus sanguineus TaxID=34632 RepID=A0A9D4YP58_RHISA|nr:hypothetical protein HPB52_010664 [Rhipicephalus sanguineus]